ncbi:MAG TPA: hypothetical protein VII81_02540 [Terriglobales bacterium]
MQFRSLVLGLLCCAAAASAQTADELVAKNLQAKGGVDKIKSIKSLRMIGRMDQGGFKLDVGQEAKLPGLLRETYTFQGMTGIDAYDGSIGWRVSPFEGRKDAEMMGEDDMRQLVEDADFYGPLVDYQQKGNKVEYLGHDTVDGDDALRLKVTLKNGDVIYYLLDPDTFLEIRTERQTFIRGSMRESVQELGSYKQVNGVYFPFSVDSGPKSNPNARARVTYDKIEANTDIPDSLFKMPAAPATPPATKPPKK